MGIELKIERKSEEEVSVLSLLGKLYMQLFLLLRWDRVEGIQELAWGAATYGLSAMRK
jgi:hypothetical protein